jgi:hypothetical protein
MKGANARTGTIHVQETLDQKLARIHADSSCRDFILADAKDADMAFGLSAPGQSPEYYGSEAHFRTMAEYRYSARSRLLGNVCGADS